MRSILLLPLLGGCASALRVSRAPLPRLAPRAARRCAAPLLALETPADIDGIWDKAPSVRVEGDSLKTWNLGAQRTERVQVSLRSPGRPIHSNVELWHTPGSYVPMKFSYYAEHGGEQHFHAIVETPKHPNTVAVFNTEGQAFPFEATVTKSDRGGACNFLSGEKPELVQGGQISSWSFGSEVESVHVLLKTDKRDMNAFLEIISGPNDDNTIVELDSKVGYETPFYAVFQTPGGSPTVRIINKSTVEFPFDATVLPYETVADREDPEVVMGAGW